MNILSIIIIIVILIIIFICLFKFINKKINGGIQSLIFIGNDDPENIMKQIDDFTDKLDKANGSDVLISSIKENVEKNVQTYINDNNFVLDISSKKKLNKLINELMKDEHNLYRVAITTDLINIHFIMYYQKFRKLFYKKYKSKGLLECNNLWRNFSFSIAEFLIMYLQLRKY